MNKIDDCRFPIRNDVENLESLNICHMRRTPGSQVSYESSASDPGNMLMKVPDISQPTESRTADPHINENEVEKAVGVRHAEAAE